MNKGVPISTGTGQHLVYPDDVEGVEPHPDVELVFSCVLDHVLVAANTSSLQGFGAELLILVGDQVHAQREVLDARLLLSKIEDTDLRVGNSTTEPRFRVRFVLAVAVTGKKKLKNRAHIAYAAAKQPMGTSSQEKKNYIVQTAKLIGAR